MSVYVVEGKLVINKDNELLVDKVERLVTFTAMDEMHRALERLLLDSKVDYTKYKGDIINTAHLYMNSNRVRKSEILREHVTVRIHGCDYKAIFTVVIRRSNISATEIKYI